MTNLTYRELQEKVYTGKRYTAVIKLDSIQFHETKYLEDNRTAPFWRVFDKKLMNFIKDLLIETSIDLVVCRLYIILGDAYLNLPWELIEGSGRYDIDLRKKPFKQFIDAIYKASEDSNNLLMKQQSNKDTFFHVINSVCEYRPTGLYFKRDLVVSLKKKWEQELDII
ncbi:hypothetical protein [Okeania sp. SIO1I7]|uniref:hypothetical protein n=1 Tax=Okeania sp. SIO1I7 TaxID=2607772 RepID=UPI0013F7825E|nr:hypothetical protein [Okeania sp. SIO1I7]NET30152.1 hypothetical protein [Okeania sp. SIO1I7]